MALSYFNKLWGMEEDEQGNNIAGKLGRIYGTAGTAGRNVNINPTENRNSNNVYQQRNYLNGGNSFTNNTGNVNALKSDMGAGNASNSLLERSRRESLLNKSFNNSSTVSETSESKISSDSNIVNAAKKYIGTPYVWGGESMSEGGMDCSGFVYNALKDAGYEIGRTTAQGYRSYGSSVSKSNMQPGDLIFFGENGNATHIGIYMGNGQMIHSSGGKKNTKSNPGKGVSIANIDSRNDFIEARRY